MRCVFLKPITQIRNEISHETSLFSTEGVAEIQVRRLSSITPFRAKECVQRFQSLPKRAVQMG